VRFVSPVARRLLIALPLAVVLLLVGTYLLVDTWLESAGGRRAVEDTLAERTGLPVRLEGDFNVMLLPAIGVSGSGLAIGGVGPEDVILRSGKYALSLALRALLEGRVVIEAIRLDQGSFHLQRWLELDEEPGEAGAPGVSLPEVRLLELHRVRVYGEEGSEQSYLLQELRIEDFAEERETPFRLVAEDFGSWAGRFSWSSRLAQLDLEATGSGAWPGTIRVKVAARLNAGSGTLEARWAGDPAAAAPRPDVHLNLAYTLLDAGVSLAGVQLDMVPLSVRGDGCLMTNARLALHLELAAERVDLDALPDPAAFSSSAEDSAAWEPPLDLNVRLSAAEFRKGGAVARQAVLRLGDIPDCGALPATPAAPSAQQR
jgi:hypothetical protein